MLHIISGLSKSKKSKYLYLEIEKHIKNHEKIIYIVPEQMTVEAEKSILNYFEEKDCVDIEIVNFTRLVHLIFRELGGVSENEYVDNGGKILLMNIALKKIKDELEFFKNIHLKSSYANKITENIELFKDNGITYEKLYEAGKKFSNAKLSELSKIYGVYEGLLNETYADKKDEISRCALLADIKKFFAGKIIIFDWFDSFTKPQYDMIAKAMHSKQIYFNLLLNSSAVNESSIFNETKHTKNRIIQIARREKIEIGSIVHFDDVCGYKSSELKNIAENLWQNEDESLYQDTMSKDVMIFKAQDVYNECEFVANEILKLIHEKKCRYKDIQIISRNPEKYDGILRAVFMGAGIPAFSHRKSGFVDKPIYKFILSLFNIVIYNFEKEDVISFVKTGLLNFSLKDVCLFENYVNLWNLHGGDFRKESWVFSVDNVSYEKTEQQLKSEKENLEIINNIKNEILINVDILKNKNKLTAEEISKNLYKILVQNKLYETIKIAGERFLKIDRRDLYEEYGDLWNVLINILEQMVIVCAEEKLSLSEYLDYFTILCSNYNMGKIPTRIDEVFITGVNNIKTENVKYTFVIGAVHGEFPKIFKENDLISDEEVELLSEDQYILPSSVDKTLKDIFLFYKCITSPANKLYISYPAKNSLGESNELSDSVLQLEKYCGRINVINGKYFEDYKNIYMKNKMKNYLMINCGNIKDVSEDLYELSNKLIRNNDYANKINDLDALSELLGDNLKLSASKLEDYIGCSFNYFAKYILNIRPLEKAQLGYNIIGSYVHNILEKLFADIYKNPENFNNGEIKVDEKVIKNLIKSNAEVYLQKTLGPGYMKDTRMKYLLNRVNKSILFISKNVIDGLVHSSFKPQLFEASISDYGEIKPLEYNLSGGKKLKLIGQVDRVDVFNKDGIDYIRIIDYKTKKTGKKLKISDVYNGLSMQMFIYLKAVASAQNLYKNAVMSGLLYYPARENVIFSDEELSYEQVLVQKFKNMKMSGLVLDDDTIIPAMEYPVEGKYIPVSYTKKGEIAKTSSVISSNDLNNLIRHIEKIINQSGEDIIRGKCTAKPLKTSRSCEWCSYQSACGFESEYCFMKQYQDLTENEIFEKMRREEK